MKNKFLTIGAVVVLAAQPMLAGATAVVDAQNGADDAGRSLSSASQSSILLLAQQGQG